MHSKYTKGATLTEKENVVQKEKLMQKTLPLQCTLKLNSFHRNTKFIKDPAPKRISTQVPGSSERHYGTYLRSIVLQYIPTKKDY